MSSSDVFPVRRSDALILVSYRGGAGGWILVVSDNGIGYAGPTVAPTHGGPSGTAIVEALVKQLEAQCDSRKEPGMLVTVSTVLR